MAESREVREEEREDAERKASGLTGDAIEECRCAEVEVLKTKRAWYIATLLPRMRWWFVYLEASRLPMATTRYIHRCQLPLVQLLAYVR